MINIKEKLYLLKFPEDNNWFFLHSARVAYMRMSLGKGDF